MGGGRCEVVIIFPWSKVQAERHSGDGGGSGEGPEIAVCSPLELGGDRG